MNKRITKEELGVFLRKHKLWLEDNPEGERADLRGANLRGANLRGADLRGADLYGADLRGAKNIKYPIACPEEGSFIGFKKVNKYIIKLEIPEEAKRCSATSRKCRCEYAKVLSITNLDGSDSGTSISVNPSEGGMKWKRIGRGTFRCSMCGGKSESPDTYCKHCGERRTGVEEG